MRFQFWLTLAAFFSISFCLSEIGDNLQRNTLYFQAASSPEFIEWCTIEYATFLNEGSGSIKVLDSSVSSIGCIATKTNDEISCKTFANITDQGVISLYLGSEGEIRNLNFESAQFDTENTDQKYKVTTIYESKQGILPKLKEPIVLVDNKVPESQAEKTFLEKYGLYIIPVVLLLMLSNGSEGAGK